MFVHVDATAACREGHAGNEQKDHQSKYCFLLHICYNGGESILLFSVVKSNCIFHFFIFHFQFFRIFAFYFSINYETSKDTFHRDTLGVVWL